MHSRLPITLAQLKAENNSEKLKKKLNQAIFVFFVQIKKNITNTIYKTLIGII